MFNRLIITPVIALFFATGSLFAQNASLTLVPGHELVIDGTSNVRDWGAKVESIDAEFRLKEYESTTLADLKPEHFLTLKLRMEVESIDSGTRGLTKNIHSYLKAKDHPYITFELNKVNEIQNNGTSATLRAEGVVTAAGKSHTVNMTVNVEQGNNGSLVFSGKQDLKMTSFDIDPPTAMLGTIRARDDFSVIYNVMFEM